MGTTGGREHAGPAAEPCEDVGRPYLAPALTSIDLARVDDTLWVFGAASTRTIAGRGNRGALVEPVPID